MFCTHTPCIDCAKMIHQAGITKVYIDTDYNAGRGKGEDFLKQSGVEVEYIAPKKVVNWPHNIGESP